MMQQRPTHGTRRTLGLLAVIAMSCIAASVIPSTAAAAYPGGNGKIVFASAPAGTNEYSIWVMNADGTGRIRLTDFAGGVDFSPAWSADGTQIVFSRRLDADLETYVWTMDADGSNETGLGLGSAPAWSPDGTKIAFSVIDTMVEGPYEYDVWTMDADGSHRTKLTRSRDAHAPAWSPDGSRIAYGRDFLGGYNGTVSTMEPDGSDPRDLIATASVVAPDWSPDGRRIAFEESTGSSLELFTIASSGGPVVNVTGSHTALPPSLFAPAYSPDGRRFVFIGTGGTTSSSDLFVINVDGSGVATNITKTPDVNESTPDWQPAPPYPFGDIATSTFVNDIVWLKGEGLTSGCTSHLYCPAADVSRGQVASFLARALELPPAAQDYFDDDETSSHESAINRIRAAGIAFGCAPDRFCPNAPITRAQLATMFARAFDLPASSIDHFIDDDASPHEADIDRLAAAGIARGCTPKTYCPAGSVTRGQVAAFVHRALD